MVKTEGSATHGGLAFALIYFTFFLDNVLLTVLGQYNILMLY